MRIEHFASDGLDAEEGVLIEIVRFRIHSDIKVANDRKAQVGDRHIEADLVNIERNAKYEEMGEDATDREKWRRF